MDKFKEALLKAEHKKNSANEIALALQHKKGEMLWNFAQPFFEFITYLQYESGYRFKHYYGNNNHEINLMGLFFNATKEKFLEQNRYSAFSTNNAMFFEIKVLSVQLTFKLEDGTTPVVVVSDSYSSNACLGRFYDSESFIEWLSDKVVGCKMK